MDSTFPAYFDGHAFHPEQPTGLEPNRRYLVTVASTQPPSGSAPPAYPLSAIRALATDMGVADLAERHSSYARRTAEPDQNAR